MFSKEKTHLGAEALKRSGLGRRGEGYERGQEG